MTYKTTFRGFNSWFNASTPNNFEHTMFATSGNKLVFMHDSDQDGFPGAVTVADGTTDPAPTIINGAAITGSTYQQIGEPNVYHEQTIQLTDTRYARIVNITSTGTSIGTQIEIVNVDLATAASSVVATYDATTKFDPIRMNNHFGLSGVGAGGSGYTNGVGVILEVEAAGWTSRAQVSATVVGGVVQSVDDIIVDGGAYTDTFNPGDLVENPPGGTGAQLSSPNFTTNRTNAERAGKTLFRISDTLFGFYFINNGINYNAQPKGTLNMMVFEDLGASIGVKMDKTVLYDVTAPANNNGSVTSSMREFSVDYLDSTNRIFVVAFQRTTGVTFAKDGFVLAGKFNATYTGLDAVGTAENVADNTVGGFNNGRLILRRTDDTHALLTYDSFTGVDSPKTAQMVEVNPTTLAVTAGAQLDPAGPADTDWRDDNDRSQLIALSPTRALWVYGLSWGGAEQAANTITVNQEPFDNTQDLLTNDRFVDTAANLTTAWAGATTGTIVCAIDTGFTHRYNGASWDLQTLNSNRRDYLSLVVQELILNPSTNTVTLGKREALVNEQFPRWRSDGAGGIEKTYYHTSSAAENCQIAVLPNGRIVVSANTDNRYNEDAPFLNITDYNARGTLDDGMSYWVQYFDPDAMP